MKQAGKREKTAIFSKTKDTDKLVEYPVYRSAIQDLNQHGNTDASKDYA